MRRRRWRTVVATTAALSMITATVALADSVEGDVVSGSESLIAVAGTDVDVTVELYLTSQGPATTGSNSNRATVVTWSDSFLSGTGCAGLVIDYEPELDMGSDWRSVGQNVDSRTLGKSTEVSISGAAGQADTSCTIRFTGSDATNNIGAGSNARTDVTLSFVAPPLPSNVAPVIDNFDGPESVEESSEAEREYTFSFTDSDEEDVWTFADGYPTCGAEGELVDDSEVIEQDEQTGSFSCKFDDGPAESTVAVKISDGTDDSNAKELEVEVLNVAPKATLTRVGPANVLIGATVTYTASATDPSSADTEAGFTWSFNEGAFVEASQLQQTYSSCGVYAEKVQAKDKNDGVSDPVSAGVNVYDGGWHGAIKPAMRNMVQKGRVVPVQIRVGCEGERLLGLTPKIQLIAGDLDPDTEPNDEAVLIATSVSGADTTGEMRPTDDGYIYNLQIPNNATAGQKFTVRVRPWGSDGAALTALLEIRR
jgi:hypothetical protein